MVWAGAQPYRDTTVGTGDNLSVTIHWSITGDVILVGAWNQ
jgi:hypothetical protein